MGLVSARLKELGLILPEGGAPSGAYVPYRLSGHTLYISGQVPRVDGVDCYLGLVGSTMNVEEAYQAARASVRSICWRGRRPPSMAISIAFPPVCNCGAL